MKKPINVSQFVGLDVHKRTIAVAVASAGSQEQPRSLGTIPHDAPRLLKLLRRQGPLETLVCAYEAGPTGYGLQRWLEKEGVCCVVVAPSKTPIRAGDRVKTDRRDASKLASFLRSGDLVEITIPDEATEAMRDLTRARFDAVKALGAARHQLDKFLLRRGRCFEGKTNWSQAHLEWIGKQDFALPADQIVLRDYLHEVERLKARVESLEKAVAELAPHSAQAPLVRALQALRGVKEVSSSTIAFEIGDLRRFARASQFMGFVGLTPTERSSGESIRRGPIAKTGNGHVRRVLVEAAWHYRRPPRKSQDLLRRSRGVSHAVQGIAWKAQCRLHDRYRRLAARGMSRQRVVVALARELAGFVWAIGQQEQLLEA